MHSKWLIKQLQNSIVDTNHALCTMKIWYSSCRIDCRINYFHYFCFLFVDGSTCVPVFRHVANHKTCQEECGKLHCCEASKSNNECIVLHVICVSILAL